MSRHPKVTLDDAESIVEAQEDMESQIEAELSQLDAIYGTIPGYSQFGELDLDFQYMGPVISNPVTNEACINSSPEDWEEFLRKVEEDLSK